MLQTTICYVDNDVGIEDFDLGFNQWFRL